MFVLNNKAQSGTLKAAPLLCASALFANVRLVTTDLVPNQFPKFDLNPIFLLSLSNPLCTLSNGEWFKITFGIAHRIGDQILRIVECNWIALHLYSFATNLNTDKPIDIRIRPNINEY